MKQKLLLFIFLCIAVGITGGTQAFGQVSRTVDSSEELPASSLIDVTDLELSGNWGDSEIWKLAWALRNGGMLDSGNTTLETVTYVDGETGFTGTISMRYFFCNFTRLESVQFPEYSGSPVDLSNTFNGCSSLKCVNSSTPGVIDLRTFSGISTLEGTFFRCPLTTLMLPTCSNAVSLSHAFQNCTSLECINSTTPGVADLSVLEGGISNLEDAFVDCSKLSVFMLPGYADGAVTFMEAFYGVSVERINSETPGVVDLRAFSGGIYHLGNAFQYSSRITDVMLPGYSGESYLSAAFMGCSSLETITGLEKLTNITDLMNAFRECYSLRAVELASLPSSSDGCRYTFQDTNPNCLKYLPGGSTIPNDWSYFSNFIIGDQSYKGIKLEDRSGSSVPGESGFNPFHCPKEFTIAPGYQITYARPAENLAYASSTGGWNTLVLPFEAVMQVDGVAKTPVTTGQSGDYWLRAFASATVEGEAAFADTGDGVIRANVPYLLALPGDNYNAGEGTNSMEGQDAVFVSAVSQEGALVTVKASSDVDYSGHENFSFRGAFAPQVAKPMYLLTPGEGKEGDSFVHYTEGNVGSFRAYFVEADAQASGSVRQLRILGGNEPTGLTRVPVQIQDEGPETPHKVWTEDGLRIIKGNRIYDASGVQTGISENE